MRTATNAAPLQTLDAYARAQLLAAIRRMRVSAGVGESIKHARSFRRSALPVFSACQWCGLEFQAEGRSDELLEEDVCLLPPAREELVDGQLHFRLDLDELTLSCLDCYLDYHRAARRPNEPGGKFAGKAPHGPNWAQVACDLLELREANRS